MVQPQMASLDRLQTVEHYQPLFRARITSRANGTAYHDAYDLNRDIMSVSFEQTLGQPAATFAITLTPQRKLGGGPRARKWNEVVRPMDYVEIDMRRRATEPWNTVLRGFVDNCFEADVIEQAGGTPQRRCVLNGRNFGKLWLEDKIFYLLELNQAATGRGVLDRYWGITASSFTPAEFLSDVYQKISKPKLDARRAKNRAIPLPWVDCTVPDQYRIYSRDAQIQTFQGPLWNLMQSFANPPYTEFLIRDMPQASAPSVEWRWAPLLTRGNKLALPSHGPLPKVRTIHGHNITSYNVGTSDNDRYTYFWAQPGQFAGTAASNINKISNPGFIDGDGIWMYGYKDFQPVFNMYFWLPANEQQAPPTNQQTAWGAQLDQLTGWLVDSFIWAVDMAEGTIEAHLEPDLAIGEFLDVPEEGKRFYIESVSHTIVSGQFAQTTLGVTRGLPLDDPSIDRPAGYDPDSDDPIPGGSTTRGPVPVAAPPTNTTAPTIIPPGSQSAILAVADELVRAGTRYQLGGPGYLEGIRTRSYAAGVAGAIDTGIDCSGFVDHCYYWGAGTRCLPPAQLQFDRSYRLRPEDLIPGDLVFFHSTYDTGRGEYITHVGIYAGNGIMITAKTDGVKYASLADRYWTEHYAGAGRFASGAPSVNS